MSEELGETPVFACCSAGIGRWFWAAWKSEEDARTSAPALAVGFEKSADAAMRQAVDRLGTEPRKFPGKWASAYRRGGNPAERTKGDLPGREKPKSRLSRPKPEPRRESSPPRLAFLYAATAQEPPGEQGHARVTRHRIVKQNARKIYVEAETFNEEAWEKRTESDPAPRMLAVDRYALRKDGRYAVERGNSGLTFYPSEDAGVQDVEAALTSKYEWCAALEMGFPCSVESVKAAYRRMARAAHPDRGGNPAAFQKVERAYRAALAYFAQGERAGG